MVKENRIKLFAEFAFFAARIDIDCNNHCCKSPKRNGEFIGIKEIIKQPVNVVGNQSHQRCQYNRL